MECTSRFNRTSPDSTLTRPLDTREIAGQRRLSVVRFQRSTCKCLCCSENAFCRTRRKWEGNDKKDQLVVVVIG